MQSIAAITILVLGSVLAHAQVTVEDFTHAFAVSDGLRKAAGKLPQPAHWIEDTDIVWFVESDGKVHDYILFDAITQQRSMLDKGRIAAALNLNKDGSHLVKPEELWLPELRFEAKGTEFSFVTRTGPWYCTLPGYLCTAQATLPHEDHSAAPAFEGNDAQRTVDSPDGKWEASIQNFNVFLHAKGDQGPAVPLSTEGSAGDYYQRSSLSWSPDSKRFLAVRVLQGMRREVHYVESSPESQLQPIASSRFYAKPGDVLDRQQPVLFNAAARKQWMIATGLFPNAYELNSFEWRKDSSAFTFVYNERGHQRLSLLSVDAGSGTVRRVIDETSKTFVEYSDLNPDPQSGGKFYRHDIQEGKEILWLSERDGWAHLYLYDGFSGSVKNQVTSGPWVVRGVDRVDEKARQIYFEAGGVDPTVDPYFVQGYRINFDGTGMVAMTHDPASASADHQLAYSTDGKFFVDFRSRVDLAPELALKRVGDRETIAMLAKADLTRLRAAGWTAPETFVAKGRDGKTDIWGLIYKPAHFDPSKRYPVVEDIYAGPQGSFVPKSFSVRAEPLTELGFVVVKIDGMGTNNRSKAFHDVIWRNLKDAGFADRILWHQAAAKRFPWYDITRVGIFGTSAGGQSAMGALLFHPEFYRAAVANSGCHDNRMDKIWWNEQWMGWPVGPEYSASSNVDNAYRLRGRLMLVMGEMDSNVDPSSTLQVVHALIKADKDFELLDVPGGGHGAGGAYGERRRMDFFVRSLTDQATPNWNVGDGGKAKHR